MKYAILDGKLTHISKVKKGTIARGFGYSDLVIAVGGRERKYWKYLDVKRTRMYQEL